MWLETTRQHWLGCLGLDAAAGCQLQVQDGWLLFVGLGLARLLIRGGSRLFNAIYTLRAAALMPALSRHLSLWVKRREYDEDAFFRAQCAARRPSTAWPCTFRPSTPNPSTGAMTSATAFRTCASQTPTACRFRSCG